MNKSLSLSKLSFLVWKVALTNSLIFWDHWANLGDHRFLHVWNGNTNHSDCAYFQDLMWRLNRSTHAKHLAVWLEQWLTPSSYNHHKYRPEVISFTPPTWLEIKLPWTFKRCFKEWLGDFLKRWGMCVKCSKCSKCPCWGQFDLWSSSQFGLISSGKQRPLGVPTLPSAHPPSVSSS